jgi:hypothetical protein
MLPPPFPGSNLGPSVADLGCLSRTPDTNFLQPGFRIQDQKDPGSAAASKSLSILTQKSVPKISEIWSGMFIPDPDLTFYQSRIRNPGVKKAPDPGSGSATLLGPIPMGVTVVYTWLGNREEDVR